MRTTPPPPTSPPPHLPDRRRNNWLWTVMLLSSRVCWKKVMFPLKIMLLYGAANLHWATICWNTEGVCLMDVQPYVSLESHNFMVTKSNALSCLGCARNGMCCHVAESICSKYIMFIDCSEINNVINNNKMFCNLKSRQLEVIQASSFIRLQRITKKGTATSFCTSRSSQPPTPKILDSLHSFNAKMITLTVLDAG